MPSLKPTCCSPYCGEIVVVYKLQPSPSVSYPLLCTIRFIGLLAVYNVCNKHCDEIWSGSPMGCILYALITLTVAALKCAVVYPTLTNVQRSSGCQYPDLFFTRVSFAVSNKQRHGISLSRLYASTIS